MHLALFLFIPSTYNCILVDLFLVLLAHDLLNDFVELLLRRGSVFVSKALCWLSLCSYMRIEEWIVIHAWLQLSIKTH